MRKYYIPQDINKTIISEVSGKLCKEFGYQNNLLKQVNENLINNFFKCAKWIEENCPSLNGEFPCRHQPYHWTKLIVENGKAYLEYGSHGHSFEIALSTTETAYKSTGAYMANTYAFENVFFFRNDALEEFLSQWATLKLEIISKYRTQSNIYSNDFQV